MAKKISNDQEKWIEAQRKLLYREGTKAPWIELRIVKEDGTETKFIARPVREFYSEQGVRKVKESSL